jgi:hypothetical protein
MSSEETLEQFGSCLEGYCQPRSAGCEGNNNAGPEGHRQSASNAQNGGQNHDRNCLLPAQSSPVAGAAQSSGLTALGIENNLHWRLDVVMNKDQHRTRTGPGPHNLTALCHTAIDATQKEGSKGSLRRKFKRGGWGDCYLCRLLKLF